VGQKVNKINFHRKMTTLGAEPRRKKKVGQKKTRPENQQLTRGKKTETRATILNMVLKGRNREGKETAKRIAE